MQFAEERRPDIPEDTIRRDLDAPLETIARLRRAHPALDLRIAPKART